MKTFKFFAFILITVLCAAPLSAIAQNKPIKLVFSTQASADVNYVKAMYMFKEKVEKSTAGSLLIEIHDNGSLMTQEGEVDALARGTLDMMFSSPFLISKQLPYLTMFTAAYIFKDQKHMRAVMDGKIGQTVVEDVAKKLNVRWLTALYCGTRQLNMRNVGRDIMVPADLAGVNLRMPNSPAWLFMGRALGANPTPMTFAEVYQGLQTGAIDGQDNPLPTTRAQKWYEVTNSIVLTGHVIEPMFVAINEKKWQSLSEDQRQAITKAAKEITAWNDAANLEGEQKDLEFFSSKGLKIIRPNVSAFMAATDRAYLGNAQMTKDWDLNLYNQIKNLPY